ncbi:MULTISPECIES: GntR family transcriptional regulator [Fusobacterium]|uniref:GntR family transcriptional regulator n=1 Tax=Fusobacterium TaxID=848 RepID=UPI001477879D|nr:MULTISPECIES: GntR family transcriptional regulator [Fusobacterium]NME36451.1 GntR family transcriptional regulator [Fusobacterium sp. FSA-380-WT-3A]
MGNYVNLKEKAYDIIKNKIINLDFQPGEYLEEKKLGELLEISRTPIREALSRLENEMWVKNMPRKGIFVTEVDEHLLNDIFEVRIHFEPAVLEIAFSNLSSVKLQLFKSRFEAYENCDQSERDKLDNDFHLYIFNSVDNIFVKNMLNTTFEHLVRVRRLSFDKKSKERIAESNKEHIEIINLILSGKKEESVKAFRNHLEKSYKYYLEILF